MIGGLSNIMNKYSLIGSGVVLFLCSMNISAMNDKHDNNILHPSVQKFVKSILAWETGGYYIRVDEVDGKQYRYTSWGRHKTMHDKPDLILFRGKLSFEGSAGNYYYQFINGQYKYKCDVNVMGNSDAVGFLEVYRDGSLIFAEPVINDLG